MESAVVAVIQSNHTTDWAEGAKLGSRGVRDTNNHKVDLGGHGKAHAGRVSPMVAMPWFDMTIVVMVNKERRKG